MTVLIDPTQSAPANVYPHYVYDLWVHRWRPTKATGDLIVVRFADDTSSASSTSGEAKAFLQDLHERMRSFELGLHPDKTRLIRFGRDAAKQRAKLGEGKPTRSISSAPDHTSGLVRHRAQDNQEAHASQAQGDQDGVAQTCARPHPATEVRVKRTLQGHLNYYSVLGNHPRMVVLQSSAVALPKRFVDEVRRPISAGSVSPASSMASSRQSRHYTLSPFRRREEPDALAAHAGSGRGARAILGPTATTSGRFCRDARS